MKKARPISIQTFEKKFLKGDYEAVIAESVDQKNDWNRNSKDFGIVIGSLCFVGRVEEAEILYKKQEKQLSVELQIQCRFFLTIGWVRVSHYAQARTYIGLNLRELRKPCSARSRFYIFQGLSFYRYFCGRWDSARRVVEHAFRAAVEDGFAFGKILSSDLKGHLLVQTENVDAGIKVLREVEKLALSFGNHSIAGAANISCLTYEAQYGLSSGKILAELKRKIKTETASASVSDTYSHSELLLELARQYVLRGRLKEAKSCLDQASRMIYMHRNRRQEAMLNLRSADLSLWTGDGYGALSLVQSAKRSLDLRVDRSLELSALGLELKIVRRLSIEKREKDLIHELQEKSGNSGGGIHKKILHRFDSKTFPLVPEFLGDRIGQLLDDVNFALKESDPVAIARAISDVIKSDYLLLLYSLCNVEPQKRTLFIDFKPDFTAIFDQGNVEISSDITPLMRSVLECLAQGNGSKQKLIETVWKYQYHPLRHDSLIYSTVTGLRKALGQRGDWIETTESGYRLNPSVTYRAGKDERAERVQVKISSKPVHPQENELNFRQLTLLEQMNPGEFIHVKAYQKQFKVSEITASRDLSDLHRRQIVLRVGRARATRYMMPKF